MKGIHEFVMDVPKIIFKLIGPVLYKGTAMIPKPVNYLFMFICMLGAYKCAKWLWVNKDQWTMRP